MPGVFISETKPGRPVVSAGRLLIPFAHTIGLRAPIFYRGAGAQWVWTRPVSVLVKEADGRESILPVIDVTRRITWTLYGVCAALVLITGLFNVSNRRKWRKLNHGQ
jgi:hypothetical protein